jgi:hypothetical protein
VATEWLAIGAIVLLGASVALQAAAWLKAADGGPGRRLEFGAIGARAAAAVALLAAAVLAALEQGGWSAEVVRQVALDLALATLTAHLILVAWLKVNAAGIVVDALAIGLAVLLLQEMGAEEGRISAELRRIKAELAGSAPAD